MNDIRDKILEQIKKGEVSMVPKWRFVLETTLWAVGLVVATVIAVYLLSFILFMLNKNGVLFTPLYGWHGVMLFIVSSPWFLISLVGIFLLVLYVLVTKFSFSYKRPLVYSMLGVVLFVIAFASILHQLSIHERMERFVERHEVPGLAPMYRGAGTPVMHEEVTIGTIQAVEEDMFILEDINGEEHTVIIVESTKQPRGREWQVGDNVFVFGLEENEVIEAFGIRPAEKGSGPRKGERRLSPPPERVDSLISTSTIQ